MQCERVPVATASNVVERLAYVVGQDRAGRWLAVESRGLCGGMFASRAAALCYAQSETGYRPGAVRMASEPLSWR